MFLFVINKCHDNEVIKLIGIFDECEIVHITQFSDKWVLCYYNKLNSPFSITKSFMRCNKTRVIIELSNHLDQNLSSRFFFENRATLVDLLSEKTITLLN